MNILPYSLLALNWFGYMCFVRVVIFTHHWRGCVWKELVHSPSLLFLQLLHWLMLLSNLFSQSYARSCCLNFHAELLEIEFSLTFRHFLFSYSSMPSSCSDFECQISLYSLAARAYIFIPAYWSSHASFLYHLYCLLMLIRGLIFSPSTCRHLWMLCMVVKTFQPCCNLGVAWLNMLFQDLTVDMKRSVDLSLKIYYSLPM